MGGVDRRMTITRDGIYREISIEREKQDRMWGGPEHDRVHTSHDWVAYITKHLGQAVFWPWTPEKFRVQMVNVAALAVAAIEWLELKPVNKSSRPPGD